MRLTLHFLRPHELDHELLWSVVGVATLAMFVVMRAMLGPDRMPQCAFHQLTGMPCLTCGATRALVALLAGDPARAFRMNPLVCLSLVAWGLFIPYGLVVSLAHRRRFRLSLSKAEVFSLRFLVPAVALLNWAWLVADHR